MPGLVSASAPTPGTALALARALVSFSSVLACAIRAVRAAYINNNSFVLASCQKLLGPVPQPVAATAATRCSCPLPTLCPAQQATNVLWPISVAHVEVAHWIGLRFVTHCQLNLNATPDIKNTTTAITKWKKERTTYDGQWTMEDHRESHRVKPFYCGRGTNVTFVCS